MHYNITVVLGVSAGIAEAASLDVQSMAFQPSILAASCVAVARMHHKVSPHWPHTLSAIAGFPPSSDTAPPIVLECCSRLLRCMSESLLLCCNVGAHSRSDLTIPCSILSSFAILAMSCVNGRHWAWLSQRVPASARAPGAACAVTASIHGGPSWDGRGQRGRGSGAAAQSRRRVGSCGCRHTCAEQRPVTCGRGNGTASRHPRRHGAPATQYRIGAARRGTASLPPPFIVPVFRMHAIPSRMQTCCVATDTPLPNFKI